MKPKKLVLSGWGPYRGQIEIDFKKLEKRGLFLITGATGAGKTTIFDAITYALYGSMSGDVREKSSVRSDFADADTATYVELLMTHGEKEYHIIRNPEYMRPKKRQGGKGEYTKEKENAVLHMPDGDIIQGTSEVNRRMREILVLDYGQFKQISMIAQGEFAKLLAASPAEKARIFREIFATSVYERFANILKNRGKELYKQVMEYRHRMEEDIHMLQLEGEEEEHELLKLLTEGGFHYDKILAALADIHKGRSAAYKVAEEAYAAFEKETLALSEEILAGEQCNEKIDRLGKALKELEILEMNKSVTEGYEEELRSARSAAKLTIFFLQWEKEKSILEALEDKKLKSQGELNELDKRMEELTPIYVKRQEAMEAYKVKESYQNLWKRYEEVRQQTETKRTELLKLQEEYVRQEAITEDKKEAYEEADKKYKRATVGIVARLLIEGEPCPVCGSLEHPEAAHVSEEIPREEQLQKLKADYERESSKLTTLHGKASLHKGDVLSKEEQVQELKRQVEEYSHQIERISQEIKAIIDGVSQNIFEDKIKQYEKISVQSAEKKAVLQAAVIEAVSQKKNIEKAYLLLENKCTEAGFTTLIGYQESVRKEEQIEALEHKINHYYNQLQTVHSQILHLQDEIKGKEKIDVLVLKERMGEKNREKKEALALQSKCHHRLQEVKKIKSSLQEKAGRMEKLNQEYGIVKDLDNLASGNNSKRLVFEQYVLAGYFEEILRAANIRLLKMTSGRYELSRLEGVSDGRVKDNLEMQILDYYTGKYRSVKTLSGGESFKASLALALGMSDVIQNYSGGIRVETLFIDEGFGTLDSESLDQACQTLMSLVEKERLIGIISHVPELAEKIENKILISKSNVGSTIQIML